MVTPARLTTMTIFQNACGAADPKSSESDFAVTESECLMPPARSVAVLTTVLRIEPSLEPLREGILRDLGRPPCDLHVVPPQAVDFESGPLLAAPRRPLHVRVHIVEGGEPQATE